MPEQRHDLSPWRQKIHEVIFEADTPSGKFFDVSLIVAIFFSVAAVVLESVEPIKLLYGNELLVIEWFFTIIFTVEYILRLLSVKRPDRYAKSFFGVIDLLSIIPTYLSLITPGTQIFLVVRIMRLLRLFRIFKMVRYVSEAHRLILALKASKQKITVFIMFVLSVVTIAGAFMHILEGQVNPGFSSIPEGIYWAIVTVSTVGYGDSVPITAFGKVIASFLMIVGFGTIAIPTGIITAELSNRTNEPVNNHACLACGKGDHDSDASFCKYCGESMAHE